MNFEIASWSSVNIEDYRDLPCLNGLYCWHYRPKINSIDVQKLYKQICSQQPAERPLYLRQSNLFQKHFVKPFFLEPYKVKLYGDLRPSYIGKIDHSLNFDDSKFEFAVLSLDNLSQFFDLASAFVAAVSPPLYIGMARDQTLRKRISDHVSDMENAPRISDLAPKCFGERVIFRGLELRNLWISFMPVDPSCKPLLADLEYFLNRSFYPILGVR